MDQDRILKLLFSKFAKNDRKRVVEAIKACLGKGATAQARNALCDELESMVSDGLIIFSGSPKPVKEQGVDTFTTILVYLTPEGMSHLDSIEDEEVEE